MPPISSAHGRLAPSYVAGHLDYSELRNALRDYGLNLSEHESKRVMKAYDDRPDGRLDILEFARLVDDLDHGVVAYTGEGRRGERLDRRVQELEVALLNKLDSKAASDSDAAREAYLRKVFQVRRRRRSCSHVAADPACPVTTYARAVSGVVNSLGVATNLLEAVDPRRGSTFTAIAS